MITTSMLRLLPRLRFYGQCFRIPRKNICDTEVERIWTQSGKKGVPSSLWESSFLVTDRKFIPHMTSHGHGKHPLRRQMDTSKMLWYHWQPVTPASQTWVLPTGLAVPATGRQQILHLVAGFQLLIQEPWLDILGLGLCLPSPTYGHLQSEPLDEGALSFSHPLPVC